jgi:surface protein
MYYMFGNAWAFNQNIDSWNTSNVTNMGSMFSSATTFNQNLASWDIDQVTDFTGMFQSATLSTANYNALLIGWSAQDPINSKSFHGGLSKYSGGTATSARTRLTSTDSWTITDGGSNANYPTSGSFSANTGVTSTGLTLNWTAGSDSVTITANLQYFVCSGASALAIDTVSECLGATQVMGWTANTLTVGVSGLSPATSYYYNVVMRDEAGDMVVYNGQTGTTSP